MKPDCKSKHSVRMKMMCESFQESWPLRKEETIGAVAGAKEILREECGVCVGAGGFRLKK